jgi:tripartite-type tricarboxylate transporter receptor subunit TctC
MDNQFVFASVDSMAIVPAMHKRPLYDSVTDFTAAGLVVEQPIVLVTRKDLPVAPFHYENVGAR